MKEDKIMCQKEDATVEICGECVCNTPEESQEPVESGLIAHAKKEFRIAGYSPIKECEDGPDKWIQENVLELLEVFAKQGHSGMSAPYAVNMFKKLAMWETLTPIQGTDDEWGEIFDEDRRTRHNNRESALLKDDKGAYYLDAIVWCGEESWETFTGTVQGITSRQYVKEFPFVPKTFHIDVISEEYDESKHSGFSEDENGVRTEYVIKDISQLDEVWKYYNKYEREQE